MIGELNFCGVFMPSVMPLAILAFVVSLVMRVILRRIRFYRLIWHPGLFDAALYLLTLWTFVLITRQVTL